MGSDAGEDDFFYAKTFGGAENGANIIDGTDVVDDEGEAAHRRYYTKEREVFPIDFVPSIMYSHNQCRSKHKNIAKNV